MVNDVSSIESSQVKWFHLPRRADEIRALVQARLLYRIVLSEFDLIHQGISLFFFKIEVINFNFLTLDLLHVLVEKNEELLR